MRPGRAIAKGIRKTGRVRARLEPSRTSLPLYEGTGVQTIARCSSCAAPADSRGSYRLNVGLIGAEAMLRLFGEPEANERAFGALARFLDLLDQTPPSESRPAVDPLGLSFQLKLLWLAGYLPHLTSCVECGSNGALVGFSARSGGAVCGVHAVAALPLAPDAVAGIERLLSTPLADAPAAQLSDRARRDALAVVTSSYEEHGGFRLRTLSA
jgi:DNA repair protein RecO (recombination protein O)